MRIRSLSWKGLALSVVVVAAVAGITLGVTTLLGVTFQGRGAAVQGGSQYVGGSLLTANRDRLAICIEAVDVAGSLEQTAKSQAEAALTEAAKQPNWAQVGLAKVPSIVDIGCPSPPALLAPSADITRTGKFGLVVNSAPVVKDASYYRVFLFILSEDKLASTFAGEYPIATQEWIRRSQDEVTPATLGLYVGPQQAADSNYLAAWLLFLVGGATNAPTAPSPSGS